MNANPDCKWPMGKAPTKRQLDKLAVADEIRSIREHIKACHNKVPQRIVNGSYYDAKRFKDNHEFAIGKVTAHEYVSASYSLNDLTRKRDYLLQLLADIS